MDFQRSFFLLAACASFYIPISHGATEIPEVMKVVTLNEVTAQGVLHLPPSHIKMEENQLCHYWISFLKEIPEDAVAYHKDFGISVVPLNTKLKSGDSIFLMAHPVDVNTTNPDFQTVTWDSSANSDTPKLEFKPLYQDICIVLKGDWQWSKADLLVTLFFENNNYCPTGMGRCKCSSQSRRCISTDLMCNGVENCGIDCQYDETDEASCKKQAEGTTTVIKTEHCASPSYVYVFMMVITGLLMTLIPAVFLLTFMYYRRTKMVTIARVSPATFDGNNNRSNGQYPHAISMPPVNDIPPRYDDVPHGVKIPISSESMQLQQT